MIYAAKLEALHQKFIRLFAHIPHLKLNEPERLFAPRQLRSVFAFYTSGDAKQKRLGVEIVDRPRRPESLTHSRDGRDAANEPPVV